MITILNLNEYENVFFLAALLLVAFVSCYCPIAKKAVEAEAVVEFQDYGPNPFVFDLEAYTLENDLFRQAIWTVRICR